MKVEPSAANVIARSFTTTQFSELPVTYGRSAGPRAAAAAALHDGYGSWPDHTLTTTQRILPPPELDCMLSTSNWSPPFPVCPADAEPGPYRRLSSVLASSAEGYVEAAVPVELRTRAALPPPPPPPPENCYVDRRHRIMTDDGGS